MLPTYDAQICTWPLNLISCCYCPLFFCFASTTASKGAQSWNCQSARISVLPLHTLPLAVSWFPLPCQSFNSLFFPADVFVSNNSGSMQSVADFPAGGYELIEGNQRLSIPLACICRCPACLQHGWLLETSHSSIELLSPLLLPSW